MDQLSSCYFCGAALNASLEEYPVVPESVDAAADDRQTVVLCGSCKPKLDAVVETLVAAVEADSDRSGGSASSNGRRGDSDRSETDTPGSDVESTLGDDADVLRPVGDERDADDSTNGSGDSDRTAGASSGRSDASSRSDAASRSDASGSNEAGGNGTGSRSDAADDRPKYTSSRRAGHDRTSADPAPDDDAAEETGGSSDDGGDRQQRDVTLTRLENTNVMRLLQNREFPVDRDDFVVVASSAYEISHSDCDKVIDLAIEHDLLDERDGQLVAGARWS